MNYVFFLSGFSFKYTDDSQNNRKRDGDHLLLHSTTSTYSRTFIHLIKILHVRWLSWDQCNDHNDVKYIWSQSQKMLELFFFCFFFLSGFSFTYTVASQDSRRREGHHLLFHSNTPPRSRTFRHLIASLHVR